MLKGLLKIIRKKEFPLFIVVLILFFLSDSILRRKVYAPPSTDGDSEISEILPEFIRNYFSRLEKKEKVQDKLEIEKDVADRRELLFDLIELSREKDHELILRQIISEDPTSYAVHKAWLMLLPKIDADEIMDSYLTYAENCEYQDYKQKNMIWESAWYNLRNKDATKDQYYKYCLKLLDNRVITSGLKDAYNKCWSIAIAKGDDFVIEESLKMKKICQELESELRESMEEP